jgi:hypothetical protein
MSTPQNPYAAPTAEADSDQVLRGNSAEGVYREGAFVVIPVYGASLPMRCVVCNAPAQVRLTRKLYWHHPGYYVLILLSALIYVVVAMVVRRRAHFELGLCDQHARRRRNGINIARLGALACLTGFIALFAASSNSTVAYLLLAIALIACVVIGAMRARVVTAHRIDKRYAWLRVGRPFLDSI